MHTLMIVLCLVGLAGQASPSDEEPRPLIIAHRGASGWLPEHSLAAYAAAYALGADYIESDVVSTRDGVLICSHDLALEKMTNIAEVYPDRGDADGKYFAHAFTRDELRPVERRTREGEVLPGFSIATFDEMLALVAHLNKATGRTVGVIPEPKAPAKHRVWGLPIEQPMLDALQRWGYTARDDAAVIQCFELDALRLMREGLGSDLTLVYLFSDPVEPATLVELSTWIDGIGPSRALIDGEKAQIPGQLVEDAHAAGLKVYPWTFDIEGPEVSRYLREWNVDGLFTNFVDSAIVERDSDDAPSDD